MENAEFVWFILLILITLIIFFIVVSNKLNRLLVKIEESESGIDVALTKRFDLLTKMLDATKGYKDHELSTLKEITKLRTPGKSDSIDKKQQFEEKIREGIRAVDVVVERYPDLKASENFIKLKESIQKVEENLQASRRIYNSNVSYYNQKVVTFPINIVAGLKNFNKKEFFEADEEKREDIKIEF